MLSDDASMLSFCVLNCMICFAALWIMAAKFEFDSRRDTAAARSVFQQSIKANPDNQHLWTEVCGICMLNFCD